MVNTDDFIKRLEHLLDYYSLSASSFADKIGVQRSSISHLLSGRNKPSLDFILKIIDVFPDINLYWMLNGKGDFLKGNPETFAPVTAEKISNPSPAPSLFENEPQQNLHTEEEIHSIEIPIPETPKTTSNPEWLLTEKCDIYKIVIFYKDGTFKDFKPQN